MNRICALNDRGCRLHYYFRVGGQHSALATAHGAEEWTNITDGVPPVLYGSIGGQYGEAGCKGNQANNNADQDEIVRRGGNGHEGSR